MRITLIALFCLLSACQSGRYIDHTDDQAATLVFSSDDLPAQPIICSPGKGLQETSLAVGIGGYKALDDLNEAMKKNPEVKARVPAGTSVIAGFRYTERNRFHRDRCEALVRFDVEPEGNYQLRLEKSPDCGITATRLVGETWVALDPPESDATCD